jgi:hypothetical protein
MNTPSQKQAPINRHVGLTRGNQYGGDQLYATSLGDVVSLPDGTHMTVRARAVMPMSMSLLRGIVVLGECSIVLGIPGRMSEGLSVFDRVDGLASVDSEGALLVGDGEVPYWTAHLPGRGGNTGRLGWSVLERAGHLAPVVVLRRGNESMVFAWSRALDVTDVSIQAMGHDGRGEEGSAVRVGAYLHAVDEDMVKAAEFDHSSNRMSVETKSLVSRLRGILNK